MELEDRLASAFLVDLPPVVDTHFTIAVMEAHARRELVESLLLLGGLSLIGVERYRPLSGAAGGRPLYRGLRDRPDRPVLAPEIMTKNSPDDLHP